MSISANEEKWLTEMYWLTPYNWLDEIRKEFDLPKRVYIHDVTLREGDQQPYIGLKKDEKIRLAQALDELGVASLEIAPAVSEDDVEVTKKLVRMGLNAKIISFVSWQKRDIDLALECDVDGVMVDFVGNPWQSKTFWNMTPDEHISKRV